MNEKVYILISDKGVDGAFSSLEKAKKAAKEYRQSYKNIIWEAGTSVYWWGVNSSIYVLIKATYIQ